MRPALSNAPAWRFAIALAALLLGGGFIAADAFERPATEVVLERPVSTQRETFVKREKKTHVTLPERPSTYSDDFSESSTRTIEYLQP